MGGGPPPPCSGRSASAFAPIPSLPKRKTPRGEVLQPRRPLPGDPRGGGATGSPGAGARGFCTVRRKPSAPQHPPDTPTPGGAGKTSRGAARPQHGAGFGPGSAGSSPPSPTDKPGGLGGGVPSGGGHAARAVLEGRGGGRGAELRLAAPSAGPGALPCPSRGGSSGRSGSFTSRGAVLGLRTPPTPPQAPSWPSSGAGGSPGGALRSYRGKAHASLALVAHAGRAGASHIPWVRAPR